MDSELIEKQLLNFYRRITPYRVQQILVPGSISLGRLMKSWAASLYADSMLVGFTSCGILNQYFS